MKLINKLKQFFCSHKDLTAIDMYKKYNQYFTSTMNNPIVKLKCDKCGKNIEMYLETMQLERHGFRIGVNTTNLEKYEQFGGKEKVKYRDSL